MAIGYPAMAQDDVTTQHAASAYAGGYITGPASNPLSFINGPAYRTFGSTAPYDLPDFAPASLLNQQLPDWISFGVEERFRYRGLSQWRFQAEQQRLLHAAPLRVLQMTIRPTTWFKLVGAGAGRAPVSAEAALWVRRT